MCSWCQSSGGGEVFTGTLQLSGMMTQIVTPPRFNTSPRIQALSENSYPSKSAWRAQATAMCLNDAV